MARFEIPACSLARRAVLRGAGAAGLAAVLAACGDGPEPDRASAPTTAPATAATTPGAGSSGEPPGIEPPDGALVAAEEVPVGEGVLVDDTLVVQIRKGTFRAYDAKCPHQGILINSPDSSGVITCPGHNSTFRAADGSRVSGPAPRGLRTVAVTVVNGYVVAN